MQKKTLSLAIFMIFILLFCITGVSKADGAEKKIKIQKWLELMHMDQGLNQEIDRKQEGFLAGLNPDLRKDFQPYVTILFDKQEIINEFFIPSFSEFLTEADLDMWINFYSSTIGQSIIKKQAIVKARQKEIIQKAQTVLLGNKSELPTVNLKDPKHAKSIMLYEAIGYKRIYDQILDMFAKIFPPESYKKFKEVFTEHYYISCMLVLIEDVYTDEELDAAIDFFSSSALQHFTKNLSQIMESQQRKYPSYIYTRLNRLTEKGRIPPNLTILLLEKMEGIMP